MELLRKTITDPKNHRHDNADKKLLFTKEHCPNTTAFHRKQWSFIEDTAVRKNIAYQMQYLEFLVHLYNDYQIYLMLESLLCKDVIVTVGGVVEAALLDLIQSVRKKAAMPMESRTDFIMLLGQAYHEHGLLTRDLWHFFHDLRKTRNKVHLTAADFKEYAGYTIGRANECIERLEKFRIAVSRN
jgi:hypothetical protein